MDGPKDAPGDVAKRALARLAKERLQPTPENYCRIYRKVEDKERKPWTSHCYFIKLIEESLGELIESCLTPGVLLEAETARLARDLGRLSAASSSEEDLKKVRAISHALALRMKRDLTVSSEMQVGLVGSIQSVISSLGALADDDQRLLGQLQSASALLTGAHISGKDVAEATNILNDTIERQRESGRDVADAQQALKAIAAELIGQTALLMSDTTAYGARVAELNERIRSAGDIATIKSVVDELDVFVKEMGASVRQSHQDMSSTHERLVKAERKIEALRKNLAVSNEKVRRDTLTGTLNRSGLDEIWDREVKRAVDHVTPLSLALLDVDNFKQLNDKFGHTVGDEALVHITSVIRQALHGTDTIARYGGEEFVILLPDTDASGAEALMRRLQRELTKHFFLHDNDRLLITFSAGVTVVVLDTDSLLAAVERADAALYQAKRQGKNRVSTG